MTYPADIDTPDDLLIAVNNWATTTTGPLNETNVDIGITSAVGLQETEGLISIGSEVIKYAFIEFSGGYYILRDCDRGYDGTLPQSHGIGSKVELRWVAAHHNRIAAAILAIENALGANPAATAQSIATRLTNNLPAVKSFSPATADWSFTHDRRRIVTVQLWRKNAQNKYELFTANVEQELNPSGLATVTILLGATEEGFLVVS